jgi:pimeloyl-ACP methyl ester carboxylesterase
MSRIGIEIGDTTLEAVVAGTGGKTVVFESGLATALEVWDAVAPRVAESTRTVRYDRRPAPPTGAVPARTAMDMAVDLEQLLRALAIDPPYVLVGHSWGGTVARIFVQRNPAAVAGLVFADATHESIDSHGLALVPAMHWVMGVMVKTRAGRRWLLGQLCPAQAPASYRARVEQTLNDPQRWIRSLRRARMEGGGIRQSLDYIRRHCPDLPPVPARVLTAGGVTGPNVKAIRRVHEAWRATVARSPMAEYSNVPTAGHQLPVTSPQEVVDAILAVLAATATHPRTSHAG